jgi:bifunctional non-homologous end joining protein LigD
MLLAGCRELPGAGGWAYEVKFDGMRAQLHVERGRVLVCSRPGRDCTSEFQELGEIGEVLGHRRLLLDGELVCLAADGKPDFQLLRARLGRRPSRRSGNPSAAATYVAFDLLHLDGHSTRALPYEQRRRLLEGLGMEGDRCWVPRAFTDGVALLAACRDQELEGVVAKRLGGRYLPGLRSDSWRKRKLRRRETFVVAGYSVSTPGKPDELFLARPRETGELIPAGSTGYATLDGESRERLRELLRQYTLAGRQRRRMHRIETPLLWVEVDSHGRGAVRDPVLRGFHVGAADAAAPTTEPS